MEVDMRPSNISARPPGATRGHACSTCRRRKLKCGGEKPACLQCVRGNRAHECLYEDQRQTPTHKLHARIGELQALVDGYERLIAQGIDISTSPPPPTHDQPIGTTQWTQAPSLSNGAGNGITSHSAPFNRTDYDRSLYSSSMSPTNQLSGQTRNALSPTNPTTSYLEANASAFSTLINPLDGSLMPGAPEEWNTEALPGGIEQRMLFTMFMAHRHQAHFDYIGSRLIPSLSNPSSSASSPSPRPHPCLINAIYLFASHFSRSPAIAPHDALFLARARAGMQAAIAAQDRLLDVIQAGCLVSLYLYFKSRVLEGYQLGGAIARLAIACGLHQIESPLFSGGLSATARAENEEEAPKLKVEDPVGIGLPEASSLTELGDRMHTFWQVWCVDKYGVMSTGLACSLPDDPTIPMLKIKTYLPPRTEVFTRGMVAAGADLQHLSSIYDEEPRRTGSPGSVTSLGYKGVEVFCAAINLKNYKPSHPEFAARYRRLDKAIECVAAVMPPLSYREDEPTTLSQLDNSLHIEPRMVWPHLLVLSARVALYSTLAHRDEGVYERRLTAARNAVAILRQIQHDDANYHEVAMAPCWKHVSETLLRHINRLRSAGEPPSVIAVFEKEADASTQAMRRICHLFAATAEKCWDDLT